MKNRLKYVIFIAISCLFVLASCDKVEAPYMKEHAPVVKGDTVRKLLFEDFTGHECVNCPTAHKTIEDLQKVYGDRIVVMAEHVGFFARPKAAPYNYDFRTAAGDAIATTFSAISAPLPKGMVNRKKQNGGYLLDRAAFGTAVSLVLDSLPKRPDIYIELNPSYNSVDSSINVEVKMTVLSNLPAAKYKVSVMLTESDIIQAQKNNNAAVGSVPEILNYNHKHVLRGAINTIWGEEFADGSLSKGQRFTKTYSSYKIAKDWKPANLSIVAFVYYANGTNDKMVIQAQNKNLL